MALNGFIPALFAATLALAGGPALAQEGAAHQHGHDHAHGDQQTPAADTPSTAAFRAANDRMHRDMAVSFTGDADTDFLRGMIPHHQGAIDMARIVLEHGKDPQVRKLAEDIIKAQEAEIATMRQWLSDRGQ